MTRAADLLSRSEIWTVIDVTSIPAEILEELAQSVSRKLPKDLVIRPNLLHKLMTSSLSSKYLSTVPKRKNQPHSDCPYISLEDLWSSKVPEEEILEIITGGRENRYSRINPKSKAFSSPKRGQIVSKAEFEKMTNRFKFDEIRSHFEHLKAHHSGENDTHEAENSEKFKEQTGADVNNLELENVNVRADRQLLDKFTNLAERFVEAVKTHIERNRQIKVLPTLYRAAQQCCVKLNNTSLADLLHEYQRSPLYNTISDFQFELCSFIYIRNSNTDLKFGEKILTSDGQKGEDGQLALYILAPIILKPYKAQVIKLNFTVQSDQLSEVIIDRPMLQVHIELQQRGATCEYFFAGVYNTSETDLVVNPREELGVLRFAGGICDCPVRDRCYVLEDAFGEEASFTPPKMWLNTISATILDHDFHTVVDESVELNGITTTALPVGKLTQSSRMPPMTKESYNLVVAMHEMINNNQVFSLELVRELQDTCDHLRRIKELVQKDKCRGFTLREGLLFKQRSEGPFKPEALCLPQSTFAFLVRALHQRGYHFGQDILSTHLQRYFYTMDLRKVVETVNKNCLACFVQQASFKGKYIYNQPETKPELIFETVYCDIMESLPRDFAGYQYLAILTDRATNYCLPIPLKNLRSAELANQLDTLFGHFLSPRRMITDYGSVFRGDFLKLCRKWNIELAKSVPRRPQANSAENYIRIFRNFFERYLINCGGARPRRTWSKYISLAAAIFNSSITMSSRGGVSSPAELFFGPHRYNSTRLVTMVTNPDLEAYRQTEGLRKIYNIRNQNRQRYKGNDIRKYFRKGMIVSRVLSKDELPREGGGVSLPSRSRVKALYVITKLTETGARCTALNTKAARSSQVFQYGEIKPVHMDSKEVHGLLLPAAGAEMDQAFTRGIFRKRDGDTLLQKVADSRKFIDQLQQEAVADDDQAVAEEAAKVRDSVLEQHGVDPETAGLVTEDEDGPEEMDLAEEIDQEEAQTEDQDEEAEPDAEPTKESTSRKAEATQATAEAVANGLRPGLARYGLRPRRGRAVHHTTVLRSALKRPNTRYRRKDLSGRELKFAPVVRSRTFYIKDAAVHHNYEGVQQLRHYNNHYNLRKITKALSIFPILTRLTNAEYSYMAQMSAMRPIKNPRK